LGELTIPFNFSDLNSEVRVFAGGAAKGSNGALLSQRQNALSLSVCIDIFDWYSKISGKVEEPYGKNWKTYLLLSSRGSHFVGHEKRKTCRENRAWREQLMAKHVNGALTSQHAA